MAQTKKIHLFANWKMYLDLGESVSLAEKFISGNYGENLSVAVFPSALAMTSVKEILKGSNISLGAQNTYWVDRGGYTGEVSSFMFKGAGCTYALVGHAERRHVFHETNHDVRQKIEGMLTASLTPVLCVGETGKERKAGQAEEVLEAQVRAAYMGLAWPEGSDPVIAYEPVWAIGTGESCDPKEAERISGLIYNWTKELIGGEVRPIILYGGSVRAENIVDYISNPHIQGVLVGGASTKEKSWEELVEALK